MKKSTKRALRTLVQLLCIVVMLAAAVWIVFLLRQEDESRSYADNLAQEVVRTVSVEPSAQPPTAPSPTEEAPQFDERCPISVDFDALDGTDIVAWLYCEEPSVSYAVVQGKDNDEYLHALPDGQYSYAGTPFMDYRNAPNLTDLNTIIYGHNMKDDTMFSAFVNYKEQTYYDAHPQMYLVTPTHAYRIELLAGCVTDASSALYELPGSVKEKEKLLADARESSTFRADITEEANDRLVTLSTCSYEFSDARFVLIGRLVEIGLQPS